MEFPALQALRPVLGTRTARRLLCALSVVLVVWAASTVLFHELGAGSLRGDEAIHATVARNSAEGPWLPLRVGGGYYLAKPPLKILAQAALFRYVGVSSFTARVIDATAGVLLAAALFLFAQRYLDRATAMLAALLPLGARGWVLVHNVRFGTQDAVFGLLLVLALLGYHRYVETGRRERWLVASAAAAGLAALVKGPIAFLLLPTFLLYEAALWRRGDPAAPPRPWSPWRHAALSAVPPLVYAVYLLSEVGGQRVWHRLRRDFVERATTGLDPTHLHGPLFYLQRIGQDFGWWLLFLLPAAAVAAGRLAVSASPDTARRARRAVVLLGIWTVVVVGGFSLSVSKLPWYVFPAYPALAFLVAAGVGASLRRLPRAAALLAGGVLVLCLAADLRATWKETPEYPHRVDADRVARAIETSDAPRFLIQREIPLQGEALYHLGAVGQTVWRVPSDFWSETTGCRYLLRGAPLPLPEERGSRARNLRLPSNWTQHGVKAWIVDLDGCLPQYVPALAFEPNPSPS